mmetsp:Transcript_13916/g.16760  ORF Transcript_13916/g.16760 Transcript_13916/m.16760 type:complete len:132 (+) Transcript_13916:558-953(+)
MGHMRGVHSREEGMHIQHVLLYRRIVVFNETSFGSYQFFLLGLVKERGGGYMRGWMWKRGVDVGEVVSEESGGIRDGRCAVCENNGSGGEGRGGSGCFSGDDGRMDGGMEGWRKGGGDIDVMLSFRLNLKR